MDYKIFWTSEAINNLEEILDYLHERWSEREVKYFKTKLSKRIELISIFPTMFPVSTYNIDLRKAVLSKQTTIYYQIKGDEIFLVFIFVNSQDIKKIEKAV